MKTISGVEISKSRLKLGAWYSIEWGFGRIDVCVIKITPHSVEWEHPKWCHSHSIKMDNHTFFISKSATFLGYGKIRPIGSWFRKNTDCWATIYTKPCKR